jgi:hypothetical protein
MPKEGAMMQLSRPFQIVLVTFCLFAAVWFFALRSHSASTSGGGSSPPSAASPAAQQATPSTPYHGPAPGVAGLTRDIEKAHGAVAQSERNAKQLQEKSQDSSPTTGATTPGASTAGAQATRSLKPKSAATTHRRAPSRLGAGASRSKSATGPANQAIVEGKLKQGNIVTVLFWNPKASVDRAVHSELQSVVHASGGKVAVVDAAASQVGSFGSFTRTVQVYQTPTILIVNPKGQTTTLVGLTDVFSIQQAIGEAKR